MIKRYHCDWECGLNQADAGDWVRHDDYAAEVATLTSIIGGLQSALEYVRVRALQSLDVSWAGPEEEPAEAVSKQYLDGLEDIKAALSDV